MLGAHEVVGLCVLAAAAAATIWGATAFFRHRDPGRFLGHGLALVQTLLVAQVGLGLLLHSDAYRAPDRLHYAYGTFALLAALSPWLYAPPVPARRLAWFVGATLFATALSIRAYTTAT
jgi:hypothetical protein